MTEKKVLDTLTSLAEREQNDARRRLARHCREPFSNGAAGVSLRPRSFVKRPLSVPRDVSALQSSRVLLPLAAALALIWLGGTQVEQPSPERYTPAYQASLRLPPTPALPESTPPLELAPAATPLPVQAARLLAWSPPSLRPLGRYQPTPQSAQPPPAAPLEAPPPPQVAVIAEPQLDLVASLALHRTPAGLL